MPRDNPWLYEQDGDLNPTWILVIIFAAVGVVLSVAAVFRGGDAAKVAALSFVGAALMALLISALPRDKAKILAKSRLPGDVARGISESAGRPFGGYSGDYDADDVELR